MAPKLDRRQFLIVSGVAGTAAAVGSRVHAEAGDVLIRDLRVDNIDQPLGLDNASPCFSWRLESSQRNVKQAAYQILVASSPSLLTRRQADLWDSGKIQS